MCISHCEIMYHYHCFNSCFPAEVSDSFLCSFLPCSEGNGWRYVAHFYGARPFFVTQPTMLRHRRNAKLSVWLILLLLIVEVWQCCWLVDADIPGVSAVSAAAAADEDASSADPCSPCKCSPPPQLLPLILNSWQLLHHVQLVSRKQLSAIILFFFCNFCTKDKVIVWSLKDHRGQGQCWNCWSLLSSMWN